jgi:hypothetical protein
MAVDHRQAAPTPPMGWNSWDCYGAAVTEAEVRANAEYMARYLKEYGWDTVVVDIQWYEPGANSAYYRPFVPLEMDEYSRLMPAVNRFPSAAGGRGFKPLADDIHRLGLKFGIHIMRGIPRQAVHRNTPIKHPAATARDIAANTICPWNTDMYGVDATKEGAQAYYDSLFELYASWDVDFVKVDDIAASRLYEVHLPEIEMIRRAIDKCGRPMVLSLSPGPAPVKHADFFARHANMWRMTDDFWDRWDLLLDMFDRCESWQGWSKEGTWPDCDMLPLGRIGIRTGPGEERWTRFTRDEQITLMTLWTIFRSPLFFGGDLRYNDEWTLSLITNRAVLDMHRTSRGARRVLREGNRIVWAADGPDGVRYVALFNIGEEEAEVAVPLDLLDAAQPAGAVELWTGERIGLLNSVLSARVAPHGAKLFRLHALT